MRKKAAVYEYMDIMVPAVIIFFVMIGIGTIANNVKKQADNEVTEVKDRVTADQDLINFLRINMSLVIDDISVFPEETRGMAFAEFFIWYEQEIIERTKLEKNTLQALNKGIETFFSPVYDEWNFRLISDGDVKHNYGNMPRDVMVYSIRLPSYGDSEVYAALYLKNE